MQRLSVASGKAERPLFTLPPPGADGGKAAPLNFQERSESPVYTVSVSSAVLSPPGPAKGEFGGAGADSRAVPLIVTSYVSDLVPFRHYMGYEITADIPTRSLVAFHAETGKALWSTGDLTLGGERKAVSFITPALLSGGWVFAGGWQPHGYLDGMLVSFDQVDGRVNWHQRICSSQMEGTMFGELAREPFASVLAEREGVIYYSTNLGAIAAVEAATGRILWLTTYESIPVKPADGRRSEFRRIVWGANPLLFVGETLIVTPRDSLYLYAIDCSLPSRTTLPPAPSPPGTAPSPPVPPGGAVASSAGAVPQGATRQGGRILWSYPNAAGDLRDLLGYAAGRLYFTGPRGVQALEIGDPAAGAPRKISGPIAGCEEGRGALTDSGVVLVARAGGGRPEGQRVGGDSRLWLVDLSLKNRHDLSGPLPPPDSVTYGGNVTVKDGRVFLTSRDLVAAFSPRPELGNAPPPPPAEALDPSGLGQGEKSDEEDHR